MEIGKAEARVATLICWEATAAVEATGRWGATSVVGSDIQTGSPSLVAPTGHHPLHHHRHRVDRVDRVDVGVPGTAGAEVEGLVNLPRVETPAER